MTVYASRLLYSVGIPLSFGHIVNNALIMIEYEET